MGPLAELPGAGALSPGPLSAVSAATAPFASEVSAIGSPAFTYSLSNGTALPGLRWSQNGSTPGSLAVAGPDGTLWIGYNHTSPGTVPNVTLVDLSDSRVIGELPGTPNATALEYDPATDRMYIAEVWNSTSGVVAVYNATSREPITLPIRVVSSPDALGYDPYSRNLFVTDSTDGNVSVVSTVTFRTSVIDLPLATVGATYPSSLTYDPVNGNMYILATGGYAEVFVVNGTTGDLVAPAIQAGSVYTLAPSLVYDPVDGRIFVLMLNNSYGSAVAVLDPAIEAAVGTIPLVPSGQPVYSESMAIDPSTGELLFVAGRWWESYAEGFLAVLYPTNGTVLLTSAYLGPQATYQAFDATSGIDYVAHSDATFISGVYASNDSTNLSLIDLGGTPYAGTYDPADGAVYVAAGLWHQDPFDGGSLPNDVVAIAPGKGLPLTSTSVGPDSSAADFQKAYAPESIAFDPTSRELFVANYASANATRLNASSGEPVGEAALGFQPYFVADDPTDGLVYFANPGEVEAIAASNGTVMAKYLVPNACSYGPLGPLEDLAVDPENGTVFLVTARGGCGTPTAMVAWNSRSGTSRLITPGSYYFPWTAVAFDPKDGDVYAADPFYDRLVVVNATNDSVLGYLPVGADPDYVAFDPIGSWILVANAASNNLTLVNGTSFSAGEAPHGSVPAGSVPYGITVDPALDQVFVSDQGGGSIVEFSTTPELSGFAATPNAIDVGTPTSLSVRASGGSGVLSYAYSGLPPGCASTDAAAIDCAPSANGTYSIQATVSDQAGAVVQATTRLVVHDDPALAVSASPPVIDGSGTIEFGAVVTGGTAPFSVSWSFGDGASALGEGTAHHYSGPGTYRVVAQLDDAAGMIASASKLATVGGSLSAAVTPPSTPPAVGARSNWTGIASGGEGPYMFNWSFGDGSTLVSGGETGAEANESTVAHEYAAPGSYRVTLQVLDAGGELAQDNLTVDVRNATQPAPAATPFPSVLVGLGVANGSAGLLVLALAIRRGRGRGPPTSKDRETQGAPPVPPEH
ncbi:MAG TPA: PKD domain-containing protein [Thermoplasmata archaeon]|nr:PKD domain-containing protein [Thermoplasmata archaeon]